MKAAIGLVLVLGGIVFGVWVAAWWAFVGGIVQVVEALKADPVSAIDIALGSARVIFFSVIGAFSAMVLVLPGIAMIDD